MCLLVVAYDAHPDYRLVLVGHRDEFHARPTAALDWWDHPAGILGGRDLQAGGTWLGLDRRGRLGVVTNYRSADWQRPGAPSRGGLVTEFLRGSMPTESFVASMSVRGADFAGFSMMAFDGRALAYGSNPPEPVSASLAPGIYGLSNAGLDTPWPKVVRTRERIRMLLEADRVRPESLFAALADRRPAADDELPDTGIGPERERLLSAPFIVSPGYGTRCSTLVMVGHDGTVRVEERRYSPEGETTGRTVIAFHTSRTGPTGS